MATKCILLLTDTAVMAKGILEDQYLVGVSGY